MADDYRACFLLPLVGMRLAAILLLLTGCASAPSPIATAVDAFAAETLAAGRTPGMSIAVARGGETVVMRGYGYADKDRRIPATAETRYRIASISKEFVAAAIMRLAEEGRLRVDDPMAKHLPELAGYADGVTIHHLLTHTSGLRGAPDPDWDPGITRQVPVGEVLQRIRNTPVVSAPGERWAYNNTGYFILGALIERITGKPYQDHFEEIFFRPLGMTSTVYCDGPMSGYIFDEKQGLLPEPAMNMSVVGAGGSFCSTVGDLLRWQRALIRSRSYAAMTTPVRLNSGATEPYGYALGIRPVGNERGISHGGSIRSFASYLSYYPDRDLHIAVLINSGGVPSRPFAEELARRIFAAMDAER